ncbi:MAG TPA: hypothetical protein VMU13_01040 [Candidatus Paceibacterota bacterium]|nr:hypothetical protein [Candidatus Paceibacterota bacterium]
MYYLLIGPIYPITTPWIDPEGSILGNPLYAKYEDANTLNCDDWSSAAGVDWTKPHPFTLGGSVAAGNGNYGQVTITSQGCDQTIPILCCNF